MLITGKNTSDCNKTWISRGYWNFEYGDDVWIFYCNSSHQSAKSFQRKSALGENVRVYDEFYSYTYTEDTQTGNYEFYPVYFDADTLNSTW